jgi:hypothetical protein
LEGGVAGEGSEFYPEVPECLLGYLRRDLLFFRQLQSCELFYQQSVVDDDLSLEHFSKLWVYVLEILLHLLHIDLLQLKLLSLSPFAHILHLHDDALTQTLFAEFLLGLYFIFDCLGGDGRDGAEVVSEEHVVVSVGLFLEIAQFMEIGEETTIYDAAIVVFEEVVLFAYFAVEDEQSFQPLFQALIFLSLYSGLYELFDEHDAEGALRLFLDPAGLDLALIDSRCRHLLFLLLPLSCNLIDYTLVERMVVVVIVDAMGAFVAIDLIFVVEQV